MAKSRKSGFLYVWGVIYPIIVYILVMAIANNLVRLAASYTPLFTVRPESADVICQGITYIIIIIALNALFTRVDNQYASVKGLHIGKLLLVLLMVILAGVGLNYIISTIAPGDADTNYVAIRDTYYSADFLLQLVVLGVVVPIAEELMYRGILYKRLRAGANITVSVMVSAVVFGLLHFNLIQGIYGALMGAMLAIIVEMTDNIVYSCVGHIGVNIFTLCSVRFGISTAIKATGVNMIAPGTICVVLAVGLLILFCKPIKKVG